MPWVDNMLAIKSSSEACGDLLVNQFLHLALEQHQRSAAALRPMHALGEKKRSSNTPCEVCTYLLDTAG